MHKLKKFPVTVCTQNCKMAETQRNKMRYEEEFCCIGRGISRKIFIRGPKPGNSNIIRAEGQSSQTTWLRHCMNIDNLFVKPRLVSTTVSW